MMRQNHEHSHAPNIPSFISDVSPPPHTPKLQGKPTRGKFKTKVHAKNTGIQVQFLWFIGCPSISMALQPQQMTPHLLWKIMEALIFPLSHFTTTAYDT